MQKKIDISALVSSRICHDLISPIGAISNGIELLELSGDYEGLELNLIKDSVINANAKIRFMRIAFGDASGESTIGASETDDIIQSMFASDRIGVDWQLTEPMARTDLRIFFNILLCMEKIMRYGGEIIVSNIEDYWQFKGLGRDMNISEFIDIETNNFHPQNTAPNIQFDLVTMMISLAKYQLLFDKGDDEISILLKKL